MNSSQPICVLTIGAKRKIEFVDKQQPNYRAAVKSLEPDHGSLYIMKSGCQSKFLHRVIKDKKVKQGRYCLSFRCLIDPEAGADTETTPTGATASKTPLVSTPILTNRSNVAAAKNLHHAFQYTPTDGYSPYIGIDTLSTSKLYDGSIAKEKICLLFGTSITAGIDGARLSRKNRTVVNI